MLRPFWSISNNKDSTNGKKLIGAPRIQKLNSHVRKHGGSDINWSNPYGNQATHFVGCTECLNISNSSCNDKKKGNAFEAKSTM
jgi:hypothetical protein